MNVSRVDTMGLHITKHRLTLAGGRRKLTMYSHEQCGGRRACFQRWLQSGLPLLQASLSDHRMSRNKDPPLALPLWDLRRFFLEAPGSLLSALTVKTRTRLHPYPGESGRMP